MRSIWRRSPNWCWPGTGWQSRLGRRRSPNSSVGRCSSSRRIWTRTATKNQLLAQLDRCFPGLTLALPDVLGTQIGRLVAAEFADPHRLAALGVTRFVRFAANRGLRVRRSAAGRLVAAARTALPAPEAVVARRVLAD